MTQPEIQPYRTPGPLQLAENGLAIARFGGERWSAALAAFNTELENLIDSDPLTFQAINVEPPTVVALAKREEELYLPGQDEPLRLSRHAFALRLLQYVRDDAHRFAQHYHHILHRKSTLGE